MPKHNMFLFKDRIMFTFLGLMLLLAVALENNLSDGTDVPHVPGTPKYITWAKYRIRVARNQVLILHEEVSVLVVSVIVVSYHPSLIEVAWVNWANNSHTHIPTHTGLIWSCATEHCFCAVKFLERLYKTLPQFAAIFAEKVEFIEALVATLMSPSLKGDKLSSDT